MRLTLKHFKSRLFINDGSKDLKHCPGQELLRFITTQELQHSFVVKIELSSSYVSRPRRRPWCVLHTCNLLQLCLWVCFLLENNLENFLIILFAAQLFIVLHVDHRIVSGLHVATLSSKLGPCFDIHSAGRLFSI